jgi:hypothetical protein
MVRPRNSDGWSKRVGTGVGPLPSLWDRYRMYGLILALVAAFVLIGLTILHHLETPLLCSAGCWTVPKD